MATGRVLKMDPNSAEGTSRARGLTSQSAMEYLMTYGWAILIIAVVLGALYSLGVFNAVNFMPKVPGGGCHVFRPNGPGTSWNVNLVGSCNNALPQYVARFNGQSSVIRDTTPTATLKNLGNSFTLSAWVYFTGGSCSACTAVSSFDYSSNGNGYELGVWGSLKAIFLTAANDSYGVNYFSFYNIVSLGKWVHIAATFSNNAITFYLNGDDAGSATASVSAVGVTPTDGFAIGERSNGNIDAFNGSIANVQIYNTSLTANQVQYLYNEGIGGVPISPQYLVGWWPLNGDTNDYSGNNNNGVPTAVTFNGTWTNGYNVP